MGAGLILVFGNTPSTGFGSSGFGGTSLNFKSPIFVLLQAIAWTEYIPSTYGSLKAFEQSILLKLGSLISESLDPVAFVLIFNFENVDNFLLLYVNSSIYFKTDLFLLSDNRWFPATLVELAVPYSVKLTSPPPSKTFPTSPKNSFNSLNSVVTKLKYLFIELFLVSTYSLRLKFGVVVVFKILV